MNQEYRVALVGGGDSLAGRLPLVVPHPCCRLSAPKIPPGLFVRKQSEGQLVVIDRELVAVGKLIVARLISGSLGSSFASGGNVTIKPSS